ncbi:hypothetical protein pb186bvf_020022 [Paramecium bursaria]
MLSHLTACFKQSLTKRLDDVSSSGNIESIIQAIGCQSNDTLIEANITLFINNISHIVPLLNI